MSSPEPAWDRPRVALDSNIWRYVLDAGAGSGLAESARANDVDVVVAPAVMHEVLRAGDDLRRRLAELVTRKTWLRLMPEAYLEAMDLLQEIRRLRPEWLDDDPDLEHFEQLKEDWQTGSPHGHWGRVRRDPASEARLLEGLEHPYREAALEGVRSGRQYAMDSGIDWDSIDVDKLRHVDSEQLRGWSKTERVEAWRVMSADWYASQLLDPRQRPNPTREWLGPHLAEPSTVTPGGWREFWFLEVSADRLPREVIRWVAAVLQATRKTNPGTPTDNQIAAYLPDCDIIATADKVFGEILARLQDYIPGHVASSVLLPGGREAIGPLRELIGAVGTGSSAR